MKPILQISYISGIVVCACWAMLLPTWVGCLYNPDNFQNPQSWGRGGVFGLRGANGVAIRAPLWNPPTAHSDSIHPTVRWPWQAPSQYAHVELHLTSIVSLWSMGILVLGVLYGLVSWISRAAKPDALLLFAWGISISLIIAWSCIFVIAVLTMGAAATDSVVIGLLSFAILAGLTFGLVMNWKSTNVARAFGSEVPSQQGDHP